MRREPGDRSEMVSQWLFGETGERIEQRDGWSLVKFDHDGYAGWVDDKQVLACDTPNYDPDLRVIDQTTILDLGDRQVLLPYGGVLPFYADGAILWGERRIPVKAVTNQRADGERAELLDLYLHPFLGAPYLWGGRTPGGVDCSGMVQMLFILMGIYLPRDAHQQAEEGDAVELVDLAVPGDLAFFDNDEGRITHVGIVLPDHRIAHASGRVRIDKLDHQGIFDAERQRYSHRLRLIRRVL
ncbi:MAG: C40 family peptidase [Flavobacteriales bacterium]|nr:C40 family peptidase [Flavobacteriales bacterium]MCB9168002.1 C40 family peptidase [Flavobacteriales bacterium]